MPNLYVKYSATSLRPPGHLLLANVRFGSKAFMRLGDEFAMAILGDLYFSGDGVSQDAEIACEWWRKSAKQGCEYAISRLEHYERGFGVPQDDVK